eukprot:1290820-Pyramimonas_sp.AAC.1
MGAWQLESAGRCPRCQASTVLSLIRCMVRLLDDKVEEILKWRHCAMLKVLQRNISVFAISSGS